MTNAGAVPTLALLSERWPASRLDRGGSIHWQAGCVFRSFGVHVGVRVNRREIIEECQALFPPAWKAIRSPGVDRLYSLVVINRCGQAGEERLHLLYADGDLIARAPTLAAVLEVFETDLHQYVAAMSPRLLFVHAGVVGWRGRAIVIPGRSFTGKTTLVTELVKAGATYYSDEFAVLDERGHVHAFARPLGIRNAECRRRRVAVGDLGGRAGRRSLPIGAVVFAPYRAGAAWKAHRLSEGLGVLGLLAETVAVRRQPQRALDILRMAVADVHVFKGVRGEATAVARTILQTVAIKRTPLRIAQLHACQEQL